MYIYIYYTWHWFQLLWTMIPIRQSPGRQPTCFAGALAGAHHGVVHCGLQTHRLWLRNSSTKRAPALTSPSRPYDRELGKKNRYDQNIPKYNQHKPKYNQYIPK